MVLATPRVRAPSVLDFGRAASCGAAVGALTALLPWPARRSFRTRAGAMVQCSVVEFVAGPQPNNVCCWQPGVVGSLRSLLLKRLQQKPVR